MGYYAGNRRDKESNLFVCTTAGNQPSCQFYRIKRLTVCNSWCSIDIWSGIYCHKFVGSNKNRPITSSAF